MSPIPSSILHLPASGSALIERLMAWSLINSGSTHLAGLTRMADALEIALRELTPDVERVPLHADGRVALRARLRPDAPVRVVCSGHYDTVFDVNHPSQTPRLIGPDRLNGPGVADMKGGIVTMLATLAAFEKTPHASLLGWTILLTPDEEIGSEASRSVIESMADSHHLALIFEPARESGDLVKSRSATGVFEATLHGRAAHAGRDPGAGRNAILALAEFSLAVDRLPSTIPNLLVNVGTFTGGGTINIVPDLAKAAINARASTPTAMHAFTAAIADLAAQINAREGYRMELSGQFNRDPLVSTPTTEALFRQLQVCGLELGMAPFDWQAVAGGSDGNLLHGAGLPVLDGLGPIGGGLHSGQEYLETPSLVQRAQLTALFLHRLASKEIVIS